MKYWGMIPDLDGEKFYTFRWVQSTRPPSVLPSGAEMLSFSPPLDIDLRRIPEDKIHKAPVLFVETDKIDPNFSCFINKNGIIVKMLYNNTSSDPHTEIGYVQGDVISSSGTVIKHGGVTIKGRVTSRGVTVADDVLCWGDVVAGFGTNSLKFSKRILLDEYKRIGAITKAVANAACLNGDVFALDAWDWFNLRDFLSQHVY